MNYSALKNNQIQNLSEEEQKIYNYLLTCVQTLTPDEVIRIFRYLFIEGGKTEDKNIKQALELILTSKTIEQDFKFILNRCCHILINSWQINPELQQYIPDLISLFKQLHPPSLTNNRTSRKLRLLVKNFVETEQYYSLERLSRVISENQQKKAEVTTSVGELINRYPYIYDHCLLSNETAEEQRGTVRRMKAQTEKKFEVDISHYVTYQVRLAQLKHQQKQGIIVPKNVIQRVENPTLLTSKELGVALKNFAGKVENGYTYQDLSRKFNNHIQDLPSYKSYKESLYEYVSSGIDPKYGQVSFNNKLYNNIKNIMPQSHLQKPDEFLQLRTSTQLLNYLVVESEQNMQHYVFVDMITNMGATATIGLLLKIVLSCQKLKPFLERKFALLFKHYESFASNGVPWLVRAMENLNVAFSINFGKADVSFLKYIL
jgi:hypothetical protein